MEIKRRHLILYSSGSLATSVSYQAFATYIQFLYIDTYGLRAAWVGIAWSIYGLWNAINDPLAGYLSDRTSTRWGRRIPYIAGLFIPLSITLYFLFLPPDGVMSGGEVPLLAYFMIFVLAFDLLWTIVVMNWTALFPEMVPDEKERAGVSAWRQVFALFGLLIGVALPPIIAGEGWANVSDVAMMIAVVTALFFGLSLLGSRERPEFQEDEPLGFMESIRATFANRNFLVFLATNLMIQYVFLAMTSTIPFYTKYALKIQSDLHVAGITLDVGLQNSIILGVAFIVALPAMSLWTYISRRTGAWRALRIGCLTAAGTLILLLFPTTFYGGLAVTALFGFSLASLLMLPDLFIADLVDSDELITGARREGLYFGMNGFIIRFAFTIQGIVTAVILSTSGYVAPAGDIIYPPQPPAAIFGIRSMIAIFPALAMVAAFFILTKYTLRDKALEDMHEEITQLHEEKRLALDEGGD